MRFELNSLQKTVWQGGRDIALNGSLIWRVHGFFPTGQFQEALKAVREAQPVTAVKVIHDAKGPCLTTSGVPDFEVLEEPADTGTSWLVAAAEELGRPFRLDHGPLLRLRILRTPEYSDIIAVGHHAFYDGASLNFLIKHILTSLEGRKDRIPRIAAFPDLEAGVPEKVYRDPKVRTFLALARCMRPFARILLRWPWGANGSPDPSPRRAAETSAGGRFIVIAGQLDPPTATRLLGRCRSEGVSVHCAVCTAFLRAAANHLPGRADRHMGFSSPVNLRPRLGAQFEEHMGPLLSRMLVHVKNPFSRDFWETCRQIQRKIQQQLTEERLFAPIVLLPALLAPVPENRMPFVVERFVHGKVRQELAVSNLGRLKFPDLYGPYRVSSIHAAGGVFADARTLTALTFRDRMFFALTFRDAVLEEHSAKRLLQEGLAELKTC